MIERLERSRGADDGIPEVWNQRRDAGVRTSPVALRVPTYATLLVGRLLAITMLG
jgi:hypothetical protein